MNQYAMSGKGTSIHSSPQVEWYNVNIDNRSMKVGGKQQLKMIDGFVIPLNIRLRLPYMDMRPYTDKEWDELPNIHITCEEDWDPLVLDHKQSNNQDWYDQQSSMPLLFPMFDEHGVLHHCIEAHTSCIDHVDGEPLPMEDRDHDSIFEDPRDEMIDDAQCMGKKSYAHCTLLPGRVSLTTNTRTQLNDATKMRSTYVILS